VCVVLLSKHFLLRPLGGCLRDCPEHSVLDAGDLLPEPPLGSAMWSFVREQLMAIVAVQPSAAALADQR
jgi:hypothetical protein